MIGHPSECLPYSEADGTAHWAAAPAELSSPGATGTFTRTPAICDRHRAQAGNSGQKETPAVLNEAARSGDRAARGMVKHCPRPADIPQLQSMSAAWLWRTGTVASRRAELSTPPAFHGCQFPPSQHRPAVVAIPEIGTHDCRKVR